MLIFGPFALDGRMFPEINPNALIFAHGEAIEDLPHVDRRFGRGVGDYDPVEGFERRERV